MNPIKKFKDWFSRKKQEETNQQNFLALKLIMIHCPITFFAFYFLLNLLRANIMASWAELIMNIIGAGCLYYIFTDLFEFVVKTIRGKE